VRDSGKGTYTQGGERKGGAKERENRRVGRSERRRRQGVRVNVARAESHAGKVAREEGDITLRKDERRTLSCIMEIDKKRLMVQLQSLYCRHRWTNRRAGGGATGRDNAVQKKASEEEQKSVLNNARWCSDRAGVETSIA